MKHISRERKHGQIVNAEGDNFWYQHGEFHRDDGPAIIYANGHKSWWLNNERFTFERWLDEVDISEEQKVMIKLQYG
jgi:hypothetical protein